MRSAFLAKTLVLTVLINLRESLSRRLPEKTTDLSNGAVLYVNVSSPGVNSTFSTTEPVGVNGTASVGLGEPDVAYIFVIDTSSSTDLPDGDCGTVLDCIQEFFKDLRREANTDGSAELVAVINFDDIAHHHQGFMHPRRDAAKIEREIEQGYSEGGTNCAAALLATKELVQSPANTAGTTVVVFAGDGMCEEFEPEDADALHETGAIVHTVAVGDNVDCNISGIPNYDDDWALEVNNLADIPGNGGVCTSVPDPHTLPNIIDDLIGTTLKTLKVQIDGGNFTTIPFANLSKPLPQDGAIEVDFDVLLPGLREGRHEVCVRAVGDDSLGGRAHIDDCHEFTVEAPVLAGETVEGWEFALVVAATLVIVLVIGYVFVRCRSAATGKEADSLEQTSVPSDVHEYVSPKPTKPIV